MEWFWYAVALPFGALLVGVAICVLSWLIKQGMLKGVAKTAGSFIEEDSVRANSVSSDAVSR